MPAENAPLPLDNTEIRENFGYFVTLPLRWVDNDMYGHLNNARYYSLFETTIMQFLGSETLESESTREDGIRCFSAENGCRYFAPVKYPEIVECGLRVAHLGNSSVRYELGLFVQGKPEIAALGHAVEIFVDALTERPTRVPDRYRDNLERLFAQA